LRTVSRYSAFIGFGLFSDIAPDECYSGPAANGVYYWIAGQRIDPSRGSPFVWRITSTSPRDETVSPMSYTNWDQNQPDHAHNTEACAHLISGRSSVWNDLPCTWKICSVCELDIEDK